MADTKLTKELVKNVCSFLKMRMSIDNACRRAGITRATHFNWIKRKRFFFDKIIILKNGKETEKKVKVFYEDEIEKAKAYVTDLCKSVIFNEIAIKKNANLAFRVLERLDPEFREKLDITDGEEITLDENELSDE